MTDEKNRQNEQQDFDTAQSGRVSGGNDLDGSLEYRSAAGTGESGQIDRIEEDRQASGSVAGTDKASAAVFGDRQANGSTAVPQYGSADDSTLPLQSEPDGYATAQGDQPINGSPGAGGSRSDYGAFGSQRSQADYGAADVASGVRIGQAGYDAFDPQDHQPMSDAADVPSGVRIGQAGYDAFDPQDHQPMSDVTDVQTGVHGNQVSYGAASIQTDARRDQSVYGAASAGIDQTNHHMAGMQDSQTSYSAASDQPTHSPSDSQSYQQDYDAAETQAQAQATPSAYCSPGAQYRQQSYGAGSMQGTAQSSPAYGTGLTQGAAQSSPAYGTGLTQGNAQSSPAYGTGLTQGNAQSSQAHGAGSMQDNAQSSQSYDATLTQGSQTPYGASAVRNNQLYGASTTQQNHQAHDETIGDSGKISDSGIYGAVAPSAFKSFKRRMMAIITIVACVISGVGGGFLGSYMTSQNQAAGNSNYTINTVSDISTTEAVAKKVIDSVVGITAAMSGGTDFFGQPINSEGVGTGIIVDAAGYILTNSHVVMDGNVGNIKVLLSNGEEVKAELLWNDAAIDLAIIKISAKGLAPAELGNSSEIQIGAYVAAIGNPLGLDFNSSVTQGVISGLNRTITVSTGMGTSQMEGLIQVDAAINSGNSGGPLLNSKGQVIGVNTAKASAEGMGFAIPIDTAKPIISKVIETGSFERAYMGVSAQNAKDIASEYPDLKLGVEQGAFIASVSVGSPAETAGLMVKDVIVAVDETPIATSSELIKVLLNYAAGDVISVRYYREGKEETAQITLATQTQVYGQR